MSKQNALIYRIIENSDAHMNAEEVYAEARHVMPSISLGTVYRNLASLSSAGRIRRVEIPDGPDRFDKLLRPHGNCICSKCGAVRDIDLPEFDRIGETTGTKILSFSVTVHDICPECGRKKLNAAD